MHKTLLRIISTLRTQREGPPREKETAEGFVVVANGRTPRSHDKYSIFQSFHMLPAHSPTILTCAHFRIQMVDFYDRVELNLLERMCSRERLNFPTSAVLSPLVGIHGIPILL